MRGVGLELARVRGLWVRGLIIEGWGCSWAAAYECGAAPWRAASVGVRVRMHVGIRMDAGVSIGISMSMSELAFMCPTARSISFFSERSRWSSARSGGSSFAPASADLNDSSATMLAIVSSRLLARVS